MLHLIDLIVINKSQPPHEVLSFKDYVRVHARHWKESHYKHQIQDWLKFIQRSQLFIINISTLQKNTTDTMRRLSNFLKLKSDWGENVSLPEKNIGKYVTSYLGILNLIHCRNQP